MAGKEDKVSLPAIANAQAAALAADALVDLCEAVLKSFNPARSTLDSHAAAELDERSDLAENDKIFVKQVLYGCVRYKRALKALITSFYYNNGATTSRGDYTKYMILSYLSLYRIKELGIPNFTRIICSQPAEKMHVFLSYLFNISTIEKWVKDEWIKYYDLAYVENTLIAGLEAFRPQIESLCDELSTHAFGAAQKKEEKEKQAGIPDVFVKPPTIPAPFNITPARPVRVPLPQKIKQEIVANPVPRTLNARTLETIDQERKAVRARVFAETQKKYDSSQEFQLHATKDTVTKLVEEKEEELAKVLNKQFVAKEAPDFHSKPAQVRMNTSAVLREDNVYKKKQAQEAKLLAAYEEDLRDSTQYYEWLAQQRAEQEEEKLRQVQQRRIASEESQRAARLANLRRVEENRKVAIAMREENKKHAVAKIEQDKAFVENKRGMVAKVKSTYDIPAKKQAKILAANKRINKEMRAYQKQLELQKRREEQEEQLRRNDRIRRIRAIERVPTKKVSVVYDPTSSGGHGLLDEMSLLETKERLAINGMNEKKAVSIRAKKIIENKMEKEHAMKARIEVIRRARDAASEANKQSRARRKEEDEERVRLEQEVRDAAKEQMADRLAKVREQREEEIRALQEEEQKITKRNLFLGAAKDIVEEKGRREFLKGVERKASRIQAEAQVETMRKEQIKAREESIRVDNRKKVLLAAKAAEAHAASLFKDSKRKAKSKIHQEAQEKRAAYLQEQVRYREAVNKLKAINPYATTHASGPIEYTVESKED